MNIFLDKIIDPIPFVKRKSLSEKDSQNKSKKQQYSKKQKLLQFECAGLGQQSNEDQEYEIEQVTQQMVFYDGLEQRKNKHVVLSPLKNSKSLGQQNYYHHEDVMPQELYGSGNGYDQIGYVKNQQTHPYNSYAKSNYQQNAKQIMSNFKTNQLNKIINKKASQKLMNGIKEARSEQRQFLRWLRDQKAGFEDMMVQGMRQIQGKIWKMADSQQIESKGEILGQQSSKQPLPHLGNWQLQKRVIKEQLQQRYQYRVQRLQQQLQQQRKYTEQQLNYYLMNQKNSQPSQSERKSQFNQEQFNENCFQNAEQWVQSKNKIKELLEQLQDAKGQLRERDMLVLQLQAENQALNQHIFDVEQKIQGIELQVEDRVRSRVKEIQLQHSVSLNQKPLMIQTLNPILQASVNMEQSTHAFERHSVNQKLEQVRKQNQGLKSLIEQFWEQKAQMQTQLQQHETIIKFREEQVKKNQEDIDYEWSQLERQRQVTLVREQELSTAQQNISRKISEIRAKQAELYNWQIQTQKRDAALDIREQQIKNKLQQHLQRENAIRIQRENAIRIQRENAIRIQRENAIRIQRENLMKLERQSKNMRNFQYKSKNYIHDFNTEGGGSFRPKAAQILAQPIGKTHNPQPQYQRHDRNTENQYQFKNRAQVSRHKIQKSFEDLDRSKFREREKTALSSNNLRHGRGNQSVHQYALPQTSKVSQQNRSKSRSKQKILIRNLNSSSFSATHSKGGFKSNKYMQQTYNQKPSSNLQGIGSKLQKLRDQIKRQIDSIK